MKNLATLTTKEDKAWEFAFTYHKDGGLSDSQADKLAWTDVQKEFPRLLKFNGIKN